MTRDEFGRVLGYLAAGCGKPVSGETAEVYWDLLRDLPLAALQAAAQQALLESQYPTLPPVGVLRQLATAALAGSNRLLTAGEAWGLLRRAVVAYGCNRQQEGLAALPSIVRQAAECLGWQAICASTETETLRAQFRGVYEGLAQGEHREQLLPAPLKQALEQIGQMPEPKRLEAK